MFNYFKEKKEKNRIIAMIEIIVMVLLLCGSFLSFFISSQRIAGQPETITFLKEITLYRDESRDEADEDRGVVLVTYCGDEQELTIDYEEEEYALLDSDTIVTYEYQIDEKICCFAEMPNETEIAKVYKETKTDECRPLLNLGLSLLVLLISVAMVYLFSAVFSTYEKIWFLSIMVLATVFSVLFPEENINGINGVWIMLLYLLDTFFNILCELLISKQSRYNFLVSVAVEFIEIFTCILLMYRFATMATTLFFWLPIDIISFINWSRHKDDDESDLTVVRKLKGYQEALVILGILLWTAVVGYFLSGLDISSDLFSDPSIELLAVYIDACASAVGIANGLFIFFRLEEQWIAWYLCALLESVINILAGQYVLLVLKLGYFTNTTYGYIRWNRYIREHEKN